ncbi:hypothetical protein [Cohnella abietis]|uniref:Uncharacterized protein n=1 Tax=Cohnella abietis TaxID=2507935 RepID=A0A3T1D2M1_9BACL|nr:hypothetical protein [Cohnella abietis]BBI32350.1 hypothetical protein KCTCHS21_17490 [Cohnella abietis]
MANISNEELEKILISDESRKYLEEHPSINGRAAKIYASESLNCATNKATYELNKAVKKVNNVMTKLKFTTKTQG